MNDKKTKLKLAGALGAFVYIFLGQAAFSSPLTCSDIFNEGSHTTVSVKKNRTSKEAWDESIEALNKIKQKVYGRNQVIEAITTAILAREFVWINGEPGGAKTFLSRIMFQSVLNSIPEKDKKIFILQFHKLLSEGKITGFQKFSSMMKEGKYEIETKSSLVADDFLFLIADEAEKSNPAVLNALLSVLNERKAFLGSRVVNSLLSSGVFTSNKTTGEFIQGFLNDRSAGEALLDRMGIKIHMPNQQVNAKATAAMNDLVENSTPIETTLPLREAEALTAKIKIPDEIMAEIVSIVWEFDRYVTDKTNQSRAAVRYGETESEYFPANQFSSRSVRRVVQIFKASLLAKQLMEGVPFEKIRFTPQRQDLSLIARSALYVGPAGLKMKTYPVADVADGIPVTSPFGTTVELAVQYSPYEGQLLLQDGSGKTHFVFTQINNAWVLKSQSAEFADWSVESAGLTTLDPKIKALIATHKIDLSKPKFDIDDQIDLLLAKGTVKERPKNELQSIKQDLERFAKILNDRLDKEPIPLKLSQQKLLPARSEKEKRQFRREMLAAPVEERVARYYDWMGYEVRALRQRFVEMEHSLEAHLTGMLSDNHLYVFGLPGGAKTALAEVILKAELKKLNADQVDALVKNIIQGIGKDQKFITAALKRLRSEKPKQFDRFLLQFHKLLPEGVLIGFPKVEKQLNEGIEEIEVESSLANQKFIFAILDEVDKANPQTITALLSILNEREVFADNQVIKTALRCAILTSNKMPNEFLEAYFEDRSTGEAVMDRPLNKVYVSNKMSSEEVLVQFLINLEKGISPQWKGLLAVGELSHLVNQVKLENPAMKVLLAEIHQEFLAKRIAVEEQSRKDHQADPREFPDYYVSAASSASDRTFNKLIDQLKSRFIVHQLMNGVAFKDLRTTIELKDLGLFFEGLGYWAPQKIGVSYSPEGIPEFTNKSEVLEKLINSGVIDARTMYHLKMMLEEAKEYSQILTTLVGQYVQGYNKEVTKYPDLFANTWMNSQPQSKANPTPELKKSIDKSIRDLSALRHKLDSAKAKGTDSLELTALTSDYQKKEQALTEYMEKYKIMTRAEMFEKMKQQIAVLQTKKMAEKKQQEEARRQVEEQRKAIESAGAKGTRAFSHRIKPGSFKMRGREENEWIDVTLTRPIDMMETDTTQIFYKTVAELLNKRVSMAQVMREKFALFTSQSVSNKQLIDSDPSVFKGDTRPVEHVSPNDILTWIKGLNELSKEGESALYDLIPGHKKGDVYRLPTAAEYKFMMSERGLHNELYPFGIKESEIDDYFWHENNSEKETHPVGQKKPLTIDGMEYYDVAGNAWKLMADKWDGVSSLKGGTNPVNTTGSDYLILGASYSHTPKFLSLSYNGKANPNQPLPNMTFRLVREVQERE